MSVELVPGERLAPDGPVRHRRPPPELAGAVSVFWHTYTPGGLARVLPDAAVDLVLSRERLVVAGPDTGPVREWLGAGPILGIQVRPGAVAALLGLPAAELLNTRVELSQLWGPAGRDLAEQLAAAPTPAAAADLIAAALRRRLAGSDLDPLADRLRHLTPRTPEVRALAAEVGLSERHLRRRAVAAYGYGPRTLSRILRFQHVLDALRAPAAPSLAHLAAHAGYADQAHLTRETTTFAGLTPTALRAALSPARETGGKRNEVGYPVALLGRA